MKVAGIIAEYNPFHNGHAYQIGELREKYGVDFVVAAMSGDFMQRGAPACMDKFTRAKMALAGGADLVLELPALWASSSAETFAAAGVRLLEATGIIDVLGFGAECECDALCPLQKISEILVKEPPVYKEALQSALRDGSPFPRARESAICAAYMQTDISDHRQTAAFGNTASSHASDAQTVDRIRQLLRQPNNILAIEYLKALRISTSSITPILIPRIGDAYHARSAESPYASATAIRELLLRQEKRSGSDIPHKVRSLMPSAIYSILEEHIFSMPLIGEDDFSQALGSRLLLFANDGYEIFADTDYALSNRIRSALPQFQSFCQFADLLKTKELTRTHICRALLHILLHFTKEDVSSAQPLLAPGRYPYLRILGFRRSAQELLHTLKQKASCTVITKAADEKLPRESAAGMLFDLDIRSGNLYSQQYQIIKKQKTANEYTQSPVIID